MDLYEPKVVLKDKGAARSWMAPCAPRRLTQAADHQETLSILETRYLQYAILERGLDRLVRLALPWQDV